jgi:hypothetical protein
LLLLKKLQKKQNKECHFENKKLKYFKTLHALAFEKLEMIQDDIMQPYHYEEARERN